MLKFFNGEEQQRILILNYNTVLLHSVGFLNYMKDIHGIDNPFSKYDGMEYIVNVLRLANKNTAKIIDKTIDDDYYFNFIKTNFVEISNMSPVAYFQNYINILLSQRFVQEIHIASPINIGMKEVFVNIEEPTFDIFNIDAIVNYINQNKITSLFVHDIDMMKQIIEHPEMDSQQFTYLLSRLGYNYREVEDAIFLKHSEIMDLKDKKQFLFGIVNMLPDEEADNILF